MNKLLTSIVLTLCSGAASAAPSPSCLRLQQALEAQSTPWTFQSYRLIAGGVEEEIDTPERAIEALTPVCERSKKPNPRFGQSAKTVREKSNWGAPDEVNRTMTARGVHEQWVYEGRGFLYFDNGVLTGAQDEAAEV